MRKNLVLGNTKKIREELAVECVAFTNKLYFYKTCLAIATNNPEVKVCNKRVYVDITDIKKVADLEDFIKCLNFFKKELNEVFIECTQTQAMLLKNQAFDKVIVGKSNCYIVYS